MRLNTGVTMFVFVISWRLREEHEVREERRNSVGVNNFRYNTIFELIFIASIVIPVTDTKISIFQILKWVLVLVTPRIKIVAVLRIKKLAILSMTSAGMCIRRDDHIMMIGTEHRVLLLLVVRNTARPRGHEAKYLNGHRVDPKVDYLSGPSPLPRTLDSIITETTPLYSHPGQKILPPLRPQISNPKKGRLALQTLWAVHITALGGAIEPATAGLGSAVGGNVVTGHKGRQIGGQKQRHPSLTLGPTHPSHWRPWRP